MAKRRMGQVVLWSIMGVMVVSMAGFGLNGQLANRHADTVIQVGDIEINADDYANALSREINRVSATQGQRLSFAEAELLGIPDQIRRQLIFSAALEQSFADSKLEVSDSALLAALQQIPSFQDASGKFDRRNLEVFLSTRRMSESEFFDLIRNDVINETTTNIFVGTTPALGNIVDRLAGKIGEKRALDYIRIDPNTQAITPASDAEARAEYDAHPEQYMAAPVNKLALAYALPDLTNVTDEALDAAYAERADQYGQPAALDYQVLTLDAPTVIKDDAAFDAALAARGLTPADISFANAGTDDLPADLIAALDANGPGVYGPYPSAFGQAVYRVTRYTPAIQLTLDEVRGNLSAQLARENLAASLRDGFETINAMAEAQSTPQAIAKASILDYRDYSTNEAPIPGLTDDPNFVAELTAAQAGETRPLVKLENGGLAYFTLLDAGEARPLAFDETKDEIKHALDQSARRTAALAEAQAIADAMAAGGSLAEQAEAKGLILNQSDLASQDQQYQRLPFLLAYEMFTRDANAAFAIDDQDYAYVGAVSQIAAFDATDDPALETQLNDTIKNTLRQQILDGYLRSASDAYEVRLNQELLKNVESQF